MSKSAVEPERPQAIWRVRVACWISKATRVCGHARAQTHAQKCVTLTAFPLQQWCRERASMLRNT
jgi:hypothetical protein